MRWINMAQGKKGSRTFLNTELNFRFHNRREVFLAATISFLNRGLMHGLYMCTVHFTHASFNILTKSVY
jgi:hypothetical protein